MSTPLWRQVIEGTYDPFGSSFDRKRSSRGSFEELDTDWRAFRIEEEAARAAETSLARQEREALELSGQEYVNLSRAQGNLQSSVGVAEALGRPGTEPKGPPPAIEGIANVLDATKSAIVGGLSGLMGWDIQGENVDQTKFAVGRFTRQEDIVGNRNRLEVAWERALKGLLGGQSYGFGDFEVLRYDQDDPRYQRVIKGLGAFTLDVALDPLTYYSFGSSVLGRVVASTGVRAASRRIAQEVLEEAGEAAIRAQVEKLSGRELMFRVGQATGRETDELLIRTPQQLVDDLLAAKGTHFMDAAADSWSFGNAAAYGARGRTGLYDRLVETVGSDIADNVWSRFPADIRGGARFRVPFKRTVDDFTGMRVPSVISMPWSQPGRGFDVIGMGNAVRKMNEARVILRTGPFRFLENVTGGRGKSWTNVLNAAKAGDGEAIEAYALHFGSMAFDDQYRIFGAMFDQTVNAGFQAIKRQRQDAANRGLNVEEISDFVSEAYFKRGRPDAPVPSSPEQVLALDMVNHLFDMTKNAHRIAVEIYGEDAANKLKDYATRMLTKEGIKDLADRYGRLEGRRRRLASGSGRLNSSFPKSMDIDKNGNLIVTAWMTPDEIFEKTDRMLFISDPFEAVAEYMNMMRRELSRDWAMNQLQQMGLLVSIGEDVLRQPTVRKIQSEVQTRMVKVRDMLNRLEKGERIPEVMEAQLEAERAGLEMKLRASELAQVEPGLMRSSDGLVEIRRNRSGGWSASVGGEPVPRPLISSPQIEGLVPELQGPVRRVDWDEVRRGFYDEQGNRVPARQVRMEGTDDPRWVTSTDPVVTPGPAGGAAVAPDADDARQISGTWEPWISSGTDADVEYVHKILLSRIATHENGGRSVNRRAYLIHKRDLEILEELHPRLRGMVYDDAAVPASSVNPNAKYRVEIDSNGQWVMVDNVPPVSAAGTPAVAAGPRIVRIVGDFVEMSDGSQYQIQFRSISPLPVPPNRWVAVNVADPSDIVAFGKTKKEAKARVSERFGRVEKEAEATVPSTAAVSTPSTVSDVQFPSAVVRSSTQIDLGDDSFIQIIVQDRKPNFVARRYIIDPETGDVEDVIDVMSGNDRAELWRDVLDRFGLDTPEIAGVKIPGKPDDVRYPLRPLDYGEALEQLQNFDSVNGITFIEVPGSTVGYRVQLFRMGSGQAGSAEAVDRTVRIDFSESPVGGWKAFGSFETQEEAVAAIVADSQRLASEAAAAAPPAVGARTIPGRWSENPNAEEVPTEWLAQFREYDRSARPTRSPQEMAELRQSIIEEGFNDPLILEVSRSPRYEDEGFSNRGYAQLTEGNHRLAIALELGIENLPVRVVGRSFPDELFSGDDIPVTLTGVTKSGWLGKPRDAIADVPPAIQDTPNLQRIGIGPQAAPAPIEPGLRREFAGRYKYTRPDGEQLDIVQVRPEGKAQVWRVTDEQGVDLGDFARREDAVAFIEGRPAAPRRPTITPENRALVVEIRRAMSELSDVEDQVMRVLAPENVQNVGRGQLDSLMEQVQELSRFLLNSIEILSFDNPALARRLISSRPGGESVERGLGTDLAALLSDAIEDVAARAPRAIPETPAPGGQYFGEQGYFNVQEGFEGFPTLSPSARLDFESQYEAEYWANRIANRIRDPKARVVRDEVWETNRAALIDKLQNDYAWLEAALGDGLLLRNQTTEEFDTWVERVITFLKGVDPSIDPFDNAVDKSRYTAAARAAGLEQFSTGGMDPVVAAIVKENDLYGPDILAETIKRHFALSRDLDGAEQFFQNYWRPYYTASKSWMTQGRGYGYTSRNIIGSMYNAWLADVGARHFNRSAAMLAARRKARDAANEILERRPVQEGETTVEAWERIFYGELKVSLREGGSGFPSMSEKNADYVVDAYRLFMERNYGGRTARSRTWGELLDRGTLDTTRYGTEGVGRRISELYGGKYVDELTRTQKALNASVDNAWMRHVTRVNESSEDYLRFAAFLRGADTYGLDDGGFAAGTWVVGTQFDYADLSSFERRVMKNIIPFYTWTRRNVPLQIRSVWMEPGKVNRLLRFHEEVVKAWTGEDKEQDSALPEWVRRRGGWMTTMTSPMQDPETVLGRIFGLKEDPIAAFIESPLTDLGMLFNATISPLQLLNRDEIINNLNPLVGKAAFELVTGRSYTSGRELDSDALAPRWAQPFALLRNRRNDDGELVFSQQWAQFFRNVLPPFAQAERLLAPLFGDDRMRRRWLTTMGSQILASPLYTVDPNQQAFAINNYAQGINEALREGIINFDDKREAARRLLDMGYDPARIAELGLSELDPGGLNFEELSRARRNVATEEEISAFLETLPPNVAEIFIYRRGFRGKTKAEAVEAWRSREPINELGALFLPEIESAFADWFGRLSESDKLGFVFKYGYGPYRGAAAVQEWSSRGGVPNRPPGLGSADFLS
jgi:hypothetical protein